MKKLTFRKQIILLIIVVISCSFFATTFLTTMHVVNSETNIIKENINSTANIVKNSKIVKSALKQNNYFPTKNNPIEKYTNQLRTSEKVDFIVVLNNELIRYSHPDQNCIGKKFSNLSDAAKSLHGKSHFSKEYGILGYGYRIFKPIYNSKHKQIGIVCVGLTEKNIHKLIFRSLMPILFGSLLGLLFGIVLAVILSRKLHKSLLNMEPEEISTKLTELSLITNNINEGLIAINIRNKIIAINNFAYSIFPNIRENTLIDDKLYNFFFKQTVEDKVPIQDQNVIIDSNELMFSTNKLISDNKLKGYITLFADQSKINDLSRKLSGNEQYINSLRLQTHEFLNQLQVISGLIELKDYDRLTDYINLINKDYHDNFGDLNTKIRSTAIVGFLIGKIKQCKTQKIDLIISSNSELPKDIINDEIINAIIKILGNLIDNSIDAVLNINNPKILVDMNFDKEEKIILIKVSDNGGGISDQLKEVIFKAGFSSKGDNRGLGLSIVKQTVDLFNGSIFISNNDEFDTIFVIELPIKRS